MAAVEISDGGLSVGMGTRLVAVAGLTSGRGVLVMVTNKEDEAVHWWKEASFKQNKLIGASICKAPVRIGESEALQIATFSTDTMALQFEGPIGRILSLVRRFFCEGNHMLLAPEPVINNLNVGKKNSKDVGSITSAVANGRLPKLPKLIAPSNRIMRGAIDDGTVLNGVVNALLALKLQ